MPTSALTLIRGRADVGIGPYGRSPTNSDRKDLLSGGRAQILPSFTRNSRRKVTSTARANRVKPRLNLPFLPWL